MPQQPISRYPEDQHSTAPYWDIWKINSALPIYPENQQHPTKISGRSTALYWDIQSLNIPPTEISGISIAFYQDLWNASTAHFEIPGRSTALYWDIMNSALRRYSDDNQLPIEISERSTAHFEISGRSTAPYWNMQKINSTLPRYIQNLNIPPTEISGISIAFYHYQDL